MARVPVKLVSWDEIVEWSRKLAQLIAESGYRPGVVIALSRGGFVPARLVCDFLDIENLLSIQSQHWTEAAKIAEKAIIKYPYVVNLRGQKALVVDDICDTGDSLILARDYIAEEWRPSEMKIATLQWISSVAKIKPDYYVMEVREWIWFQYPWTRLEDTYQFIKRMMSEAKKEYGESSWSYSEIIARFREWYGIDVGESYYRDAIKVLEGKNIVKYDQSQGKYVYLGD